MTVGEKDTGFCKRKMEAFFLKAFIVFSGADESHPEIVAILTNLAKRQVAYALWLVKVVRYGRHAASSSPLFPRVEQLVYEAICPHA